MSSLSQAAADFIQHLTAVRRLSAHTIDSYRRDLRLLLADAGDTIDRIDSRYLRRLLTEQARRGMSPATMARRLSTWRMFFDYLQKNGQAASNPALGQKAPKKPARLPRALTPDEAAKLMDTATDGKKWQVLRDAAMFELLYATGLRVSELTALNVNDLVGDMVLVQRGKGGRGRVLPAGSVAKTAVQAWLSVRTTWASERETALFVNHRGQRLSVRTVQQRLAQRAALAGFAGRVSPHVLRHSCASHFLQSSGDLRATQDLLGHQDIASTQIYTRLDFQNLAQIYDRAHPRADRSAATKRQPAKQH